MLACSWSGPRFHDPFPVLGHNRFGDRGQISFFPVGQIAALAFAEYGQENDRQFSPAVERNRTIPSALSLATTRDAHLAASARALYRIARRRAARQVIDQIVNLCLGHPS